VCAPSCSGKQCGSDGCGGSCGSCPSNDTCNAQGQCACVPQCSGKQCGPDGCGGTCGGCGANQTCNGSGQCVAACSTEEFDIYNEIRDTAGICSDGATYTVPSVMFISVASANTTYAITSNNYLYDKIPLGQSDHGAFQCCYVDPVGCVGYQQRCTYQGRTVGCVCTAARTWSASANSCTTESAVACN
jgi:hypothetical protein